jgi:TetR/AcrR family transcriptional regulator, regulator of biofilm formation and stress response
VSRQVGGASADGRSAAGAGPRAAEVAADGRVARGDESRRRLLAATLRVMEQGGVAAVSHRSVAAEAGVAAASVRYHFGGIDDLLVAAMTTATEEWAATLRDRDEPTHLGRLAAFLADESLHHRERAVAEFELYLLAARRPALRSAAVAWLDVAIGPLADGLDDVGRRAFAAVLDGTCLHGLLADDPADATTIEAVLRRVCGGEA